MRKNFRLASVMSLALVIVLVLSFAVPAFAASGERAINANYRDITILVNGTEYVPTDVYGNLVEPFLVDGNTFVPIRAVSEMLGYEVNWDEQSSCITIDAPELVEPLNITDITDITAVGDDDFTQFVAGLEFITNTDLSDVENDDYIGALVTAVGLAELGNAYTLRGVEDGNSNAAYQAGLIGEDFDTSAASLNDALYNVAAYVGATRGYVGNLSDADIIANIGNVINSIPDVLNEELIAIAAQVLDAGLITGFNIRHNAFRADFDPERTIVYGHSDLAHAKQLIILLKSLDMDARVAIEPKTSWFIWEGLNYGNEFDIHFEFATTEEKLAFDGVIKEYAQRTRGVDEITWIYGSWVDPVYTSDVVMNDDYLEIVNNTVRIDNTGYYLTTYGLKDETSDVVAEMFESLGANVEQSPLFANIRFHDYLVSLIAAE